MTAVARGSGTGVARTADAALRRSENGSQGRADAGDAFGLFAVLAILAALFDLAGLTTDTPGDTLPPVALLICCALWSWANLLLFQGKPADRAALPA